MAASSSENEKDPAFAVHFFWDLEDTRVLPNQVSGLATNIEASLKTVDERYYLADKKVAVGHSNLDFFLQEEGFHLVDAPKPERGCIACETEGTSQPSDNLRIPYERREGVAQMIVLQEMLKHVLQVQDGLSRNVLLVSGNSDFILPLGMLKSRGYNIFLAVLKDAEEEYKRCGTFVWDWDMMKERAAGTILRNP